MSIFSPAPRSILHGVQDVSTRAQPRVKKPIPTDCPHFYLFTEKGPTLPSFVDSADFNTTYGPNSLEFRSKYFTHGVLGYNAMVSNGNLCMVQRLKPTDASPNAGLVLWLELTPGTIPQYIRDPLTGKYLLDANFNKQLDGTNTAAGFTGRWYVTAPQRKNAAGVIITQAMIDQYNGGDTSVDITAVGNDFGNLSTKTSGAAVSYPIMELEVSNFGAYGNRAGVRLWTAKTTDNTPVDESVVNDNKSMMYRMQVVYKDDDASSPVVQETIRGSQYLEFSFKEGVIDRKFGRELWSDYLLTDGYNVSNNPTVNDVVGLFGRHHVYYNNITAVSAAIQTKEALVDANVVDDADHLFMMNIFDGTNKDDVPYRTFTIKGPSDGGRYLNSTTTLYASGGSDGTMNNDTYDSCVAYQLTNYGNLEAKMLDALRYPVTTYLDTGFKLDTKKKMLNLIGKRKDIIALVCPFDFSVGAVDADTEYSISSALAAHARLQPESSEFGTPVIRAAIYGHSGRLINSAFKKQVPWIIDVATKIAKYMGAGDGKWKTQYAFDDPRNNRVDTMMNITIPYKDPNSRINDWALGVTTVQYSDESVLFTPGWPTCYPDSTSVLNNIINAYIICDLEKVCMRAWTQLAGNSQLTNGLFIEKSNAIIRKELSGKYDNRVVIVPETIFTDDDSDRGFSYSCKLNIYMGVAKTVGAYHIVTRRLSELSGGN